MSDELTVGVEYDHGGNNPIKSVFAKISQAMGGGNVDADLSVSDSASAIPSILCLNPLVPLAQYHCLPTHPCLHPAPVLRLFLSTNSCHVCSGACFLCAQLSMGDNSISGDVKYTSGDTEATASVNSGSSNVVEKVELVQRQV